MNTVERLAEALLIEVNTLQRLLRCRNGPGEQWYRSFESIGKNGKKRLLHAPNPLLKGVQRAVYHRLLRNHPTHPASTGFVPGLSIADNAIPHTGNEVLIRTDIRDFFPSVTSARVFGLFRQLGYDGHIAAVLKQLTTLHGVLPQGAPSSPAIANLVARRLDSRLAGLAQSANGHYTRYADDMTLSGPAALVRSLPLIQHIVEQEGFHLADEKTRVIFQDKQQRVTGLTVNQRVNVPRHTRRLLRAMRDAQAKGRRVHLRGYELSPAAYEGYEAFETMVNSRSGNEQAKRGADVGFDSNEDAGSLDTPTKV